MAIGNALNLGVTGVVTASGTGTWTGSTTTQYNVLLGNTSNTIANAAPSATSGVPLVSAGSSANPAFGTAVVEGGGTGVTTMTTAYAPVCAGTTATGALQVASTGLSTAGYVLTSNGASALPSFQAVGGGGGLVYLSTATASASSSLTFTSSIDSTYDSYMFEFNNIYVSGGGIAIYIRTSANAGVSWDSGAGNYEYKWASIYTSTYQQDNSSSATAIRTGASGLTNNYLNGFVFLYNPTATSNYMAFDWKLGGNNINGSPGLTLGYGTRKAAAAINGVQFFPDSGTITAGTIKMYGFAKPS